MPDRHYAKARLRKELRQRRRSLGPAAQLTAADNATRHLLRLPRWPTARHIALYLANDGEMDTAPLSALCRAAGKQLYLPAIDDHDRLTFAEWLDDSVLEPNRFGIPEPPASSPRRTALELDIIVVPLVAWDRFGGRLGMGGGFYDRSLTGVENALLVGLAHTLQEVPRVPRDDWDISLDFVVTDSALHQCRGGS